MCTNHKYAIGIIGPPPSSGRELAKMIFDDPNLQDKTKELVDKYFDNSPSLKQSFPNNKFSRRRKL